MTEQPLFLQLLAIVRAAQHNPSWHCCFTVGDFCYRWQTEAALSPAPIVRIWSSGGQDQGFAWLSGGELHLVTPLAPAAIHREMVEWGEIAQKSIDDQLPRISVDDRAVELHRMLSIRGYQPAEPVLIHRSIPLHIIPDGPSPPSRYRISTMEEAGRIESWTAAYREAFAPEEMTAPLREAVSRSPLYRPELDLIACDDEGAVAAFGLVWFDGETTGTFEPLGCRPSHRRRGLSRALMGEGLRRLMRLGVQSAYVTTSERRTAANRLYESVGFQTVALSRTWRWGVRALWAGGCRC